MSNFLKRPTKSWDSFLLQISTNYQRDQIVNGNMPMPSFVRHSDPVPRRMEMPSRQLNRLQSARQMGGPISDANNLSVKQVDKSFSEAGPNSDGILEPSKAAAFFQRSGLSRGQLSQVSFKNHSWILSSSFIIKLVIIWWRHEFLDGIAALLQPHHECDTLCRETMLLFGARNR